jgi:hypothetical protein
MVRGDGEGEEEVSDDLRGADYSIAELASIHR